MRDGRSVSALDDCVVYRDDVYRLRDQRVGRSEREYNRDTGAGAEIGLAIGRDRDLDVRRRNREERDLIAIGGSAFSYVDMLRALQDKDASWNRLIVRVG